MISSETNILQRGDLKDEDFPMLLSLWLMPPSGDIFDRSQDVINDLSALLGGPRFSPHITLGGVTVHSQDETLAMVDSLRDGLSGYGPVECAIGDTVRSGKDWKQALVLELVAPLDPFLGLCRASRSILNGSGSNPQQQPSTTNDVTFPPPLGIPHLSLYYGDAPPPPSETFLMSIFGNREKSFRADRIMLLKVDPFTTEGVPQWEPLMDMSLV